MLVVSRRHPLVHNHVVQLTCVGEDADAADGWAAEAVAAGSTALLMLRLLQGIARFSTITTGWSHVANLHSQFSPGHAFSVGAS